VLSRWSQVGALVFARLAGRQRLRDVVTTLASQAKALAALGLTLPRRSISAEANERRPAALYRPLCLTLYTRGQAVAPGHGFRFKRPIFSLDRTTLSLCLSLFPWAHCRQAKGALTWHTLLDHAGHIPTCVGCTAGKRREMAVARGLHLPKGSIVAMDRGDLDYGVLVRLHHDGVYFVIRQKVKARFHVTARVEVDWQQDLPSDQHVVLRGRKPSPTPRCCGG
jgi:hypothetical protein